MPLVRMLVAVSSYSLISNYKDRHTPKRPPMKVPDGGDGGFEVVLSSLNHSGRGFIHISGGEGGGMPAILPLTSLNLG